jgi:uncharacterized protein involved in exopolysaccharide biosynthesis
MISNDGNAVENAEFDLGSLWRVIWDRRVLVAATTFLSGAIAVVIALTVTPIFRAEVVVVEVRDESMGGGSALASQLGGLANLVGVNIGGGGNESREAQALLRSRRLVEEFIQRYKLLPELFPTSKKSPTLWQGVRAFREGMLSFRDDKRGGTTTIVIQWKDPKVTARWANDFVALANELRRNQVLADAKRNIAYLNEQVARTNVVEVQRVMYNLIEGETKKLMLANARAEFAFSIVDPAVPPEIRISPKRTIMVLFGGVLGFAAGVILAIAHKKFMPNRKTTVVPVS